MSNLETDYGTIIQYISMWIQLNLSLNYYSKNITNLKKNYPLVTVAKRKRSFC
uniref:Uncharacterized protein n=1 Tax=Arion vulgaris TaxID=1028688 RepID=A0A0B6Y8P5_9EUPU